MPLAISVHSFIDQLGVYAGLAAIPGLALLALLYFTQAREVTRLRTWAAAATEREAELQARLVREASAAQRSAAGQPGAPASTMPGTGGVYRAAPGVVQKASSPATGGSPASPRATPGAPQPTGAPGAPPPAPNRGAPQPAPAPNRGAPQPAPAPNRGASQAAPATAVVPPAIGGGAPSAAPQATPAPGSPPTSAGPRPVTAAASAAAAPAAPPRPNGPPQAKPAAPPAAKAAAAPAAVPGTPRSASPLPPPRAAALRQPDTGRAAAAPGRGRGAPPPPPAHFEPPTRYGRLPGRAIALIAAVAIVLVVIGVLVVTQLGGGTSKSASAHSSGSASGAARSSATGGAVTRSDVTVAVLNATTQPGLAKQVSSQLVQTGFKGGQTANAATQQTSTTQVAYSSGQKRAAIEVARVLGVSIDSVVPIDSSTQALAGSGAGVVVTVGSDRAGRH